MMGWLRRVRRAAAMLRLRDLGATREACPMCGFPWLVRIAPDALGVRCPRCGGSAIALSLGDVLQRQPLRLAQCDAYELSAQGPVVEFLQRNARTLTTSEYLDGVEPGRMSGGVLCQDVQQLTFADASFDLCTSTEVFEHVENDAQGFREIHRVLRPGGAFVFTVPIDPAGKTVERTARDSEGRRVDVLPPEYHGDRYRGDRVFTFRNYGADIVERLRAAGFAQARIEIPSRRLFGHARPVVVGVKET